MGLVLLALGVAPHLFALARGQHPTALGLVVSAALCAGAIALLARFRLATWIALAASALVVATGVAGLVTGRWFGLPLPPWLSLGAGIYVCLRLALGRLLARERAVTPESK